MRSIIVWVATLQLLAACSHAAAADKAATITPVEKWSCLFGGQEVKLHFRVTEKEAGNAGVEGSLQWHYSANQHTLARGEVELRRRDSGVAEVTLQVPKVRDGVIFQTDLAVAYVPRGANGEAATLTKPLWLFPEDPFADQRQTLNERSLSVFDPEGRTADLFEKLELPHQLIRNTSALDDRDKHSYVIVGEGTSLIRNRGLAERLLSFAAAGGTVLMLAPSEGIIPMSGEADEARPGELRFRQHHVIRDFDKRLDARFLPGTDDFAGSKVSLRARLSRIGLEVSEDGDWPWLTIEYPETNGRFIFCGFNLIKHWENGPTSRYLLNRILTPQPKH